jgi:hypothetical protein
VWRLDEKARIGVPVSAHGAHPGPAVYDPRDPGHRDHALYALLQRRLPDASEDRRVQFTAACHTKGITADNLHDIYLLESVNAIWFDRSWPPGPFAKVDLTAPMPSPQQSLQQVQAYDQQQSVQQAEIQARQAQIHQQQGPMQGGPTR